MGFEFEIQDLERMQISSPSYKSNFVEPLIQYSLYGLLDPKAPLIDAPLTATAMGVGYWTGYAVAAFWGMVFAATLGWILDPHHLHDYGYDEFYKTDEGEYYSPYAGPSGYEEQPSDMNW